jgi:spore germination protein
MALSLFGFFNGLSEHARGYPYLHEYGNFLDGIGVFPLTIQLTGELSGLPSRRLIHEARGMGIKVYLVLTNLTPQGQISTEIITRLIHDKDFSSTVIRHLRNTLNEYRFDGVNFDFRKAMPLDREGLTHLIHLWAGYLKLENYLVSMNLPFKTREDYMDPFKGAYDYQALGQIVDSILLFPFEEPWITNPPGFTFYPWVSEVLEYALGLIPSNQVYLGISTCGYDWEIGGKGKTISYQRAIELSRRYGAPLLWDNEQRSTYYTYNTIGKKHIVYLENLKSLKEKFALAEKYQLGGLAIWKINSNIPDFGRLFDPMDLKHSLI